MKKVGYDIDNVIVATLDLSLILINERYGTNYRRSDCVAATFEESFGFPKEEIDKLFEDASMKGRLMELKVIPDAKRVINKYHYSLDQYFITARSCSMINTTYSLFDRERILYLPGNISFENFTPEKKVKVAKELGIELFVEDNLDNANAIAEEAGIPVILVDFDYPFNRGKVYHDFVSIATSWIKIDKELGRLLNPFKV
ncbi:MAG: hypothetical protein V1914_01355 [archaeon]